MMELYTTAASPAPPGATVMNVATQDKLNLRAARWSCAGPCAGTVAILQGRAEFIEKYFEVIAQLLDRNFDVVALDWRGQGGSERLLSNRVKGHVGHFDDYQRDLDALRTEVLEPFGRAPFFALGASMAGAILLEQARAGRSLFERIVLSAPMIDLDRRRFGRISRVLAQGLAKLGLGSLFAPGANGGNSYIPGRFEGNVLTSDPIRYARAAELVAAAPDVAIGGPTIGWAAAAFRLMKRFQNAEYSRRILTPVLILAAGADAVVDTAGTEAFASRLKAGRCITLRLARHEILMERDAIREQFWAAFDAFIPGSLAAVDRFAAALAFRPAGSS